MLNVLSFNEKIIYIGDIMKKFILLIALGMLFYSASGNAMFRKGGGDEEGADSCAERMLQIIKEFAAEKAALRKKHEEENAAWQAKIEAGRVELEAKQKAVAEEEEAAAREKARGDVLRAAFHLSIMKTSLEANVAWAVKTAKASAAVFESKAVHEALKTVYEKDEIDAVKKEAEAKVEAECCELVMNAETAAREKARKEMVTAVAKVTQDLAAPSEEACLAIIMERAAREGDEGERQLFENAAQAFAIAKHGLPKEPEDE